MMEVVRRLVWFTLVACVAAYSVYFFVGSAIEAQAADSGPVAIRDVLSSNTHNLFGMVPVPSTCRELSVRTEARSETAFAIIFTTWQDPSVVCTVDTVPRAFHAVLFAPAVGVSFVATLDGAPLPIAVIPVAPIASSTTQ